MWFTCNARFPLDRRTRALVFTCNVRFFMVDRNSGAVYINDSVVYLCLGRGLRSPSISTSSIRWYSATVHQIVYRGAPCFLRSLCIPYTTVCCHFITKLYNIYIYVYVCVYIYFIGPYGGNLLLSNIVTTVIIYADSVHVCECVCRCHDVTMSVIINADAYYLFPPPPSVYTFIL